MASQEEAAESRESGYLKPSSLHIFLVKWIPSGICLKNLFKADKVWEPSHPFEFGCCLWRRGGVERIIGLVELSRGTVLLSPPLRGLGAPCSPSWLIEAPLQQTSETIYCAKCPVIWVGGGWLPNSQAIERRSHKMHNHNHSNAEDKAHRRRGCRVDSELQRTASISLSPT